jgi:Sulfotransferase family
MGILVVGMHRSGTSAVAELLVRLGLASTAPEDLMPAHSDNARGYWESVALTGLDDEILAEAGGTWDVPPDLTQLAAEEHDAIDRVAGTAYKRFRDLHPREPWMWKDPRLGVLLRAHHRILAETQALVMPWRPPAEVAASLAARDGMAIEAGLLLWARYTHAVLRDAGDVPVIPVDYVRLVEDPEPVVEQLVDALDRVGVEVVPGEWRDVIDSSLHRQRVSDTADEGQLDDLVAALRSRGTSAELEVPDGGWWSSDATRLLLRDHLRREASARDRTEAEHRAELDSIHDVLAGADDREREARRMLGEQEASLREALVALDAADAREVRARARLEHLGQQVDELRATDVEQRDRLDHRDATAMVTYERLGAALELLAAPPAERAGSASRLGAVTAETDAGVTPSDAELLERVSLLEEAAKAAAHRALLAEERATRAEEELAALRATRTFRMVQPARRVYGRVRGWVGVH